MSVEWETVEFLAPTAKGKRVRAVLRAGDRRKTLNFGSAEGSAFVDHKDPKVKAAWLARHQVREDWSVPDTAGSLSRWVLWGDANISKAMKQYAKRFGLKLRQG